jgi:hypothetical protein
MKNRKWLTYTLGALITLIVLGAVGLAGFRIGMMQTAPRVIRPSFAPNFNNMPNFPQGRPGDNGQNQFGPGNPRGDDNRQSSQGDGFRNPGQQMNPHENWNKNRGDNSRGWDMPNSRSRFHPNMMFFMRPILGLIFLIILGLIVWGAYSLIKKSGWRLTRVPEIPPASPEIAKVEAAPAKKKTSK